MGNGRSTIARTTNSFGPAPVPLGTVLDRYEVVSLLGEGGMAAVYRVRHATLGSDHALKLLHVPDPVVCQRLLEEGRLQARLNHPNIVRVTDVIEVGGAPGLVMDLVEGPSLADRLQAGRPSVGEAEAWFRGIVAGVGHAHEAGVVHRDLKPGNVLLSGDPLIPRVADFGIAKHLQAAGPGATRPGVAMGTPFYMAPEQFRDAARADSRADLFSLGVILYELLCGVRPFGGDSLAAVGRAVMAGQYRDPGELSPGLPERLVRVVRACLATSRERRVQDCGALLTLLDSGAMVEVASTWTGGVTTRSMVDETSGEVGFQTPPERAASEAAVLLLHTPGDAAAAETLADALAARGLRPWLDKWELVADHPPPLEVLREALARVAAVVVCSGAAGPPALARELAEARADPHRPVLEIPLDQDGPAPSELEALVANLETWFSQRGLKPPSVTGVPYRGLDAFESADARWFAGREEEAERLLEVVRQRRLTLVAGPSGSGKSSLVRAGLIPAVRAGHLDGTLRWRVLVMRPGPRPCHELALKLATLRGSGSLGALHEVEEALLARPSSLADAVDLYAAETDPVARFLLVVDQLEELFTLCGDARERDAFVAVLLRAATVPAGRIRVLASLRADFLGKCVEHPDLGPATGAAMVVVRPMDPADLRRAIEVPAARAGMELAEGLAGTLVDEVAGQPGDLPLLQFALYQLWLGREGSRLTWECYQAIGGLRGAIARRADQVLASLGPEERVASRQLFQRLVMLGEATEDTRRPALRAELVAAGVKVAMDRWIEARLLTASEAQVEVAHEVLIQGWPTLRGWLDADREALLLRQELGRAADRWGRAGRPEEELWRGARLEQARALLGKEQSLPTLERTFLEGGLEAERQADLERARQRRRIRLAGGALVLVLAAFGATSWVQLEKTRTANRDVTRALAAAESRGLAAEAGRRESTGDPAAALALRRASQAVAGAAGPTATSVQVQRLAQQAAVRVLDVGQDPVDAVEWVDGGARLLTWSSESERAEVWNPATGRRVLEVPGAHWYHRAGNRLVIGARYEDKSAPGSRAEVWDLAGGQRVLGAVGPVGHPHALSPNGRWLAFQAAESLRIWDLDAGQEVASRERKVTTMALSPAGDLLATSAGYNHGYYTPGSFRSVPRGITLWAVPDLEPVKVLPTLHRAGELAFSPDGALLAPEQAHVGT